jgi:CDP-diacylglycerol--glycerol-3-phosphate 3-phosphatidyltransferase
MERRQQELIKAGLIPDWLDLVFLKSVTPLIWLFSSMGINPNWITFASLVLNAVGAVLVVAGKFLTAGIIIAVAGIFDFVDGKVAARSRCVTILGGLVDSVLDRYSDLFIFIAIAAYFALHGFYVAGLASMLAMIGALMTSYTKALAASYGFRFRMGAVRRQERITLICFGLCFHFLDPTLRSLLTGLGVIESGRTIAPIPLSLVIYFLALFSNLSAIQRFHTACQLARAADAARASGEKAMSAIADRTQP